MILRGIKKAEYRNRPTKVRGLIHLYAGLKPGTEESFRDLKVELGEMPKSLVVGTADLVNSRPCRKYRGDFVWILRHPKRLRRPFKPKHQPQPAWYFPK